MKKTIFLIIIMLSIFSKGNAQYNQLATNFEFNGIDGNVIKISDYKNKVILIVNVASRCGFTNQYKDLQELWANYKDKGLVVIGVPTDNFKQEPGTNKEIKDFCETTFGIDFPMTTKVNVTGDDVHPFYVWANSQSGQAPKWNFYKYLIAPDGSYQKIFSMMTKPNAGKVIKAIESILPSK